MNVLLANSVTERSSSSLLCVELSVGAGDLWTFSTNETPVVVEVAGTPKGLAASDVV